VVVQEHTNQKLTQGKSGTRDLTAEETTNWKRYQTRVMSSANQVNLAVFVGAKFRGMAGALAAVIGLLLIPMLIILGLGYAYFQFHQIPALQSVLHGAAAAAVALTLAMAIKTGRKCLQGIVPLLLFAAIFMMNGVLRWHLLPCLALLAPLSLVWGWPKTKKP
jgi:chromate transporter